jgi:hypothetical protein
MILNAMIAQFMQQNLAQQLLANLQIVGVTVGDIVLHLVHVVWDGSVLVSVQMRRGSVALALEI